jgi:hypothetical protein
VPRAHYFVLTNQRALINEELAQMTVPVQLIAALGGGWDKSQVPTHSRESSNEFLFSDRQIADACSGCRKDRIHKRCDEWWHTRFADSGRRSGAVN